MKVIVDGDEIDLGLTEATPTIGIVDYSRRVTDDFGVTTVVQRSFARRMSVRFALPFDQVDEVQRRLAAYRARSAQWVADEDCSWLNFVGFYKDFSLDLAVPPRSFCSLTVEGLAETEVVPDGGEDPAPGGGASTLLLLQPVTIAGAALVSTNVAETDYPEWAGGTSYVLGARVIKAATHRVYESAAAANLGNDPAGDSGKWFDVGPTNRWAMFDEALGTITSRAGSIVVTIDAGAADALALIDVVGSTVRVQTTGYDVTQAVGEGAVTFLDLPGVDADITVTIAGTGTVSAGTLLVGSLVKLGITGDAPTAGITDFSKKEVDDFGEPSIVERAWAKQMGVRAAIATDAIDLVANRIAAVRAKPALWIADDGTDALTIWGFFKDFSIERGETISLLSLNVEGLSEAMPLSNPFFGISMIEKSFYKRSATMPATPIGGSFDFDTRETTPPAGWTTALTDGTDAAWTSSAIAAKEGRGGSAAFSGHSAPAKAFQDGEDGAPGSPGAPGAAAKLIFVTSNLLNFPYDAAGSPKSNTATISATRQNAGAETTQWQIEEDNGTVLYSWRDAASLLAGGAVDSAPDGDTLTLSHTRFQSLRSATGNNPNSIIYRARLSSSTTIEDKISLTRVQDGSNGSPGAPGAPGADGLSNWIANMTGVSRAASTFTFVNTHANPNYDDVLFSSERGVGAVVSFVVDQSSMAIVASLNTDPEATSGYAGQDYMLYFAASPDTAGNVMPHVSGSYVGSTPTTYSPGDRFTLRHRGTTIQCFKNGSTTPFYTFTGVPATGLFALDIRGRNGGKTISKVSLTFAGNDGNDGAPGAPGSPGSNGVSPVLVTATPETVVFGLDYAGAIKGGQLSKLIGLAATQAGSAVTITSTAIVGTPVNCTASVSGTSPSIDTITGTGGSVTVDVVASGQTIRKTITWSAVKDGNPSSSVASIETAGSLPGSYTAMTGVAAINASPTGKLKVNFSVEYSPPLPSSGGPANTIAGQFKIQYRLSGGSFTDLSGSEVTGSTAQQSNPPNFDDGPGAAFLSPITITGLTAGAPYEFRIMNRKSSGSAGSGTAIARLNAEHVT